MKERVGVSTFHRAHLPNQWRLERIAFLSKEAKRRLKWID